eukprot:scaffold751_cov395-Prasinococcus_capsulatus_cf.AAC.5
MNQSESRVTSLSKLAPVSWCTADFPAPSPSEDFTAPGSTTLPLDFLTCANAVPGEPARQRPTKSVRKARIMRGPVQVSARKAPCLGRSGATARAPRSLCGPGPLPGASGWTPPRFSAVGGPSANAGRHAGRWMDGWSDCPPGGALLLGPGRSGSGGARWAFKNRSYGTIRNPGEWRGGPIIGRQVTMMTCVRSVPAEPGGWGARRGDALPNPRGRGPRAG